MTTMIKGFAISPNPGSLPGSSMRSVPTYDGLCPDHGVTETVALCSSVHRFGDLALSCAVCAGPVRQVITTVQGARIDDQENVGSERRDSTAGLNLGLPGRFVSIGRDRSGKERYDYVPRSGAEVGSNKRAREIAKAHNLTPLDSGRYRSSK